MNPLNYSTRLEINILAKNMMAADTDGLSTFIAKNKIPAVVLSPQYIDPILIDRNTRNGSYKIICAVDFEIGRNSGLSKLRSLPRSVLLADGFEILLTPKKNERDSKNELKLIKEFITNINPIAEVRWVLGLRSRTRQDLSGYLNYFKEFHANYIRIDHQPELTVTLQQHLDDIEYLREHVATPIKVCGSIDLNIANALYKQANRFDVTVTQAKKIIKAATEVEHDSSSTMDIETRARNNNAIREDQCQSSQLRCHSECGCHHKKQ